MIVNVEGFGEIEVPDGMSDDDIGKIIRYKLPKQQQQPAEFDTDKPWALTRGIVTGLREQNPDLIAESLESLHILTGLDSFKSGSDYFREIAASSPEAFKTEDLRLSEIDSLEDTFTFVGEELGKGLASTVPSIISGLTVGVGATAVGGPGVGIPAGAVAALLPAHALNSGELYKALKDAGVEPERAAQLTHIYSPFVTALDSIPAVRMFGRVKGQVMGNLVTRAAKLGVEGFTLEGLTEAAQESLMAGVVSTETGQPYLSLENAEQIATAGIAGALTGGFLGGVGGVFTRRPDVDTDQPSGPPLPGGIDPALAGFYSQVDKVVGEAPQETMPGDQWANYLWKQPGIKREEMEQLHLEEYLRDQEGPVSKADITDYIANNGIELTETLKTTDAVTSTGIPWIQEWDSSHFIEDGSAGTGFPAETRVDVYQHPAYPEISVAVGQTPETAGTQIPRYRVNILEEGPEGRSIVDAYESENRQEVLDAAYGSVVREELDSNAPIYKRYALPGGENYSELLIQAPMGRHDVEHGDGRVSSVQDHFYESPHFTEPNIIAHVRFKDRINADGNKVLFIEEVQSDWHQDGRERGYQMRDNDSLPQDFEIGEVSPLSPFSRRNGTGAYGVFIRGGLHPYDIHPGYRPALSPEQAVNNFRPYYNNTRVPDGPFKRTWHELAMKRMLHYAAENGYDKIAWTDGNTQNERYSGEEVDGEKTGQNVFYDEILPRFVNQYAKRSKWQSRVVDQPLNDFFTPEERFKEDDRYNISFPRNYAHELTITPEMRADLMRGQPLFATERGEIGADIPRLIKLFGPKMYDTSLPQVSAKELLQNSFDAIKRMQKESPGKKGRIDYHIVENERTISVIDNGAGMTKDMVKDGFLKIGGSIKGEGVDASGGFGLAKLAFLFGNEWVELNTIRNGKQVTLKATSQELLNNDFTIEETDVSADTPNGTTVTVKVPEKYIDENGETRSIEWPYYGFDIFRKPLIGDVEVKVLEHETGEELRETLASDILYDLRVSTKSIGVHQDLTETPKLTSVVFPWGSMDVYFGKERKQYGVRHSVLSDGIFQFDAEIAEIPNQWGRLPYELIINVKSDVEPTSRDYPFNNQREQFNERIRQNIATFYKYLRQISSGRGAAEHSSDFVSKMERLTPAGFNITPEAYNPERRPFEGNAFVQKEIGDIVSAASDIEYAPRMRIEGGKLINDETNDIVFDPDNISTFANVNLNKFSVDQWQIPHANDVLLYNQTNRDIVKEANERLGTDRPEAELFLAKIQHVIALAQSDISTRLPNSRIAKSLSDRGNIPVGIEFGKGRYGAHVNVPYRAILINPLESNLQSDEGIAASIVSTIIHEFTHEAVSSHNEDFVLQLHNLQEALAENGNLDIEYRNMLTKLIGENRRVYDALKGIYDDLDTENIADNPEGDDLPSVGGDREGIPTSGTQSQQQSTDQGRDTDVFGNAVPRHDGSGPTGSLGDVLLNVVKPPSKQAKTLERTAAFLTGGTADLKVFENQHALKRFILKYWADNPAAYQNIDLDTVMGVHEQGSSLMAVALSRDWLKDQGHIYHEAFHHIEDFFLTPAEQRALERYTNALRDFIEDNGIEERQHQNIPREIRAYAAQVYAQRRNLGVDLPRTARTLLQKIILGLERMYNWLSGNGYTTIPDIYEDFYLGKIGARALESNVEARHSAAEAVENKPDIFADWFNNGIVTNITGDPRPIYHGSPRPFDVNIFEAGDIGVHFSIDADTANIRAQSKAAAIDMDVATSPAQPTLYSVFTNIKNPLRLDDLGSWSPDNILNAMVNHGILSDEEANNILNKADPNSKDFIREAHNQIINHLNDLGYDSIVYANEVEGVGEDNYIIFKPDQVKSIFNREPRRGDPEFALEVKRATSKLKDIASDVQPYSYKSMSKFSEWINTARHIAITNRWFAPVWYLGEEKRNYRLMSAASAIQDPITGEKRFGLLGDATNEQAANVFNALEVADQLQEWPADRPDGSKFIQYEHPITGELTEIELTPEESEIFDGVVSGFQYVANQFSSAYRHRVGPILDQYEIPRDIPVSKLRDVISLLQEQQELHPESDEVLKALNDLQEISIALTRFENYASRPYLPHIRFGNWGISVKKNGKLLHFEKVETEGVRNLGAKKRIAERVQELKKQFPGASVSSFRATRDLVAQNTTEDFMVNFSRILDNIGTTDVKDYESFRESVEAALPEEVRTLPTKQEYTRVRKQVEDFIRRRGFSSHFLQREDIPGYDRDFKRVVGQYLLGASNFISQLRYNVEIADAVRNIPSQEIEIQNFAEAYMNYIGSPHEEWGWVRQTGFLYFLGGNISSAVLQLVTLPEFTWAWLSQFSDTPLQATRELGRAIKDVSKLLALSSKAWAQGVAPVDKSVLINLDVARELFKDEPELLEGMERAYAEGITKPIMIFEQMGLDPARASDYISKRSKWRAAINILPSLFNLAEVTGRTINYVAAFRMAQNPGVLKRADGILADNHLWQQMPSTPHEFASLAIGDTFGMYGKGNRARMMRGGFGASFLQFTQYPLQMIELLSRLAVGRHGKEGRKAAALMMLSLFMMAGWQGLPLAENLKDGLEALLKWALGEEYDIDNFIKEIADEVTGEPWVGEIVSRGGLRYLGIDVARRVGLGDVPAMEILMNLFGERSANESLGVPWSMTIGNLREWDRVYKATGDPMRATSTVLPSFMRNAYEGARWASEGRITSTRGDVLVSDEEMNPLHIVSKILGFAPERVSREREKRHTINRISQAVAGAQSSTYRRLANEYVNMRRAGRRGDQEEVNSRRENIRRIHKNIREENKNRPLEERIIINSEYLRQLIIQLDTGRQLSIPRKARRAMRDIEQRYRRLGDNER